MGDQKTHPAPWARVTVMLLGLLGALLLAWVLTGSVIPRDSKESLIFQNGLLLLVLGSAIIEHKFTRPADAVVNGLMGVVTLVPVYPSAPRLAWAIVFSYALLIFVVASICVALSEKPAPTGRKQWLTNATYYFATTFGQARIFFSVLILFGAFSFYSIRSTETVILLLFWAFYVLAWFTGLPTALTRLMQRTAAAPSIASIVRVDAPNIVRAELVPGSTWTKTTPKACCQADGTTGLLVPLYSAIQADKRIGTGLFIPYAWAENAPQPGQILDVPKAQRPSDAELSSLLGGDATCPLIGFVVEGSEIGSIRFEIWDPLQCEEGQLVWIGAGASRVYYQIVNGETREEAFESNRHGFQVAVAAQVGTFVAGAGFQKYPWLPSMNAPVFGVPATFGVDLKAGKDTDFQLGTIPKSSIPVSLTAAEAFDHHVAILGVTGSGKTELTFDLIRHAIAQGSKVIAVDLTARYTGRLADLTPTNLSLTPALASELSARLFAVETGTYGAGKERGELKALGDKLTADIKQAVVAFMQDGSGTGRLGLITLPEISNTKATLFITELFLTIILNYAKETGAVSPRTLIVLEEAHTVIPEPSTMGLGDYDSRGLVGKIAQIALQGRKYRVGLLVVAQRTATVSKSVLTQCNTIISFSCIDDTSIGFLSNVFGSEYASLLPTLPHLQAVAFGKAIRSQRPLIVQIPFSEAKRGA